MNQEWKKPYLLYKDGYGKVIILTETGRQLENYDTLHSNDTRIQLLNNGIPSGNILITDIKVSSTLDEAYAVKKAFDQPAIFIRDHRN